MTNLSILELSGGFCEAHTEAALVRGARLANSLCRAALLLILSALLGGLGAAHADAPKSTQQRAPAGSSQSSAVSRPTQQGNEVEAQAQKAEAKPKRIGIVLFPDFETLDVFGPVQMWGRLPDHEVVIVSEDGRPVKSSQGLTTSAMYSFRTSPQLEVLMVPGGTGARAAVNNPALLEFLRKQSKRTEWTTSVCTGSALLAKAGILDGRSATTNKLAYRWVTSQSANVRWQASARWVVDGKYVTSSGVSAGTDMALALVEKLYGRAAAEEAARIAEYTWNDNPNDDPFAVNEAVEATGGSISIVTRPLR